MATSPTFEVRAKLSRDPRHGFRFRLKFEAGNLILIKNDPAKTVIMFGDIQLQQELTRAYE